MFGKIELHLCSCNHLLPFCKSLDVIAAEGLQICK